MPAAIQPGRATGAVQPGALLGATSGPLVFGLLVDNLGYPPAWALAGIAAVVGTGVMLAAGRELARTELRSTRCCSVPPAPTPPGVRRAGPAMAAPLRLTAGRRAGAVKTRGLQLGLDAFAGDHQLRQGAGAGRRQAQQRAGDEREHPGDDRERDRTVAPPPRVGRDPVGTGGPTTTLAARVTSVRQRPDARDRTDELERASLSTWATLAAESKGRDVQEEPDPLRTAYQIDRDRLSSCTAFARLAAKTFAFEPRPGGGWRTQLDQTLLVARLARTLG